MITFLTNLVTYHAVVMGKKSIMSKTIKLSGGHLGHWIAPKNDKILKDLLKYNFGKSDDMPCSNSGEEIIMSQIVKDQSSHLQNNITPKSNNPFYEPLEENF